MKQRHLQFSIEVTVEALEGAPVVVVTATSLAPPRNYYSLEKVTVAGMDERQLNGAVKFKVEQALRDLILTSGLMENLL